MSNLDSFALGMIALALWAIAFGLERLLKILDRIAYLLEQRRD